MYTFSRGITFGYLFKRTFRQCFLIGNVISHLFPGDNIMTSQHTVTEIYSVIIFRLSIETRFQLVFRQSEFIKNVRKIVDKVNL